MKIYYPNHTRLDVLAVGVMISFLMQHSLRFQRMVDNNGNRLFIVGFVLVGCSFWICNDQTSQGTSVFVFTCFALSYGIILMCAVSRSFFLFTSKSYVTPQLAGLSYAGYLFHKGIIHMVQGTLEWFDMETSDTICLLICLARCIAGGVLYRMFIERPSFMLKYKVLNRKNNI